MIDYVRGRLAFRDAEYVVVDVGGVGYRVWCSSPFDHKLRDDEEVTFFIHYHVREDAHLLFGFPTREEQYMFRRLLDVTGIGPKVALGILAGAKPGTLIAAIQSDNISFLTKLPGVGKKTAQRIILDLKDKLAAAQNADDGLALAALAQGATLEGGAAASGAWLEAKEALMALGYGESEADRALAAVRTKQPEGAELSVDALLRQALQTLYKA